VKTATIDTFNFARLTKGTRITLDQCEIFSNPTMSTEFLDRLASQLKIGKDAVSRRAIERILDVIKKSYEHGKYESPVEAERDFRKLVEGEAKGK
jgi:hypothetical protein